MLRHSFQVDRLDAIIHDLCVKALRIESLLLAARIEAFLVGDEWIFRPPGRHCRCRSLAPMVAAHVEALIFFVALRLLSVEGGVWFVHTRVTPLPQSREPLMLF